MNERGLAPPTGMAPPVTATLPDGVVLELRPLAREITDRHLLRHAEDLQRYGGAAREWCTHDNQHLINWAVLAVCDALSFHEQLEWLAHVLTSRGYPLANLADNLETAAETARQLVTSNHAAQLASELETGALSFAGLGTANHPRPFPCEHQLAIRPDWRQGRAIASACRRDRVAASRPSEPRRPASHCSAAGPSSSRGCSRSLIASATAQRSSDRGSCVLTTVRSRPSPPFHGRSSTKVATRNSPRRLIPQVRVNVARHLRHLRSPTMATQVSQLHLGELQLGQDQLQVMVLLTVGRPRGAHRARHVQPGVRHQAVGAIAGCRTGQTVRPWLGSPPCSHERRLARRSRS